MVGVGQSMDGVCHEEYSDFHLLEEALFTKKAVEDLFFGLGIKAGKDIVEDDELLLCIDGAGKCNSLFLAAAKGDACTSYWCCCFSSASHRGQRSVE